MALDPEAKPLVDAINAAAAEAGPLARQTVHDRREAYRALAMLAGPGPELHSVTDRVFDGVTVRHYAQESATGIFVFLHGGGYTIGDLDTHDQTARQLALESKAHVLSVDYRLAPEYRFPAGFEDCWTALQWVDRNRAQFGRSDQTPIVVGGDSAGGNFAAGLAIAARDAGLTLAGQLLVYPAVDVNDQSPSMAENAAGYVLTRETMDWFHEQYQSDPLDWRASPILADLTDVAPALVITAEFDPLRDQGIRYVRALQDAGVPAKHSNYDGMVHVFFQLGPLWKQGAAAVTEVANTARELLDAAEVGR